MSRFVLQIRAVFGLIVFITMAQVASAHPSIHASDEPCEPPEGFIPIRTVEDLYAINEDLTGSYFLCNDIDLSGIDFTPIGPGWFSGFFEGNHQRILNLTIDASQEMVGFFARIGIHGIVQNLTFVNPQIRGTSRTGVLAGSAVHVHYHEAGIANIHVVGKGYVEGDDFVGGLVGQSLGLIERSSVASHDIVVTGNSHVGGLVGFLHKNAALNWGSVYDSFSLAEVHGVSHVGGVAGAVAYASRAIRCYSAGKVFGETQFVGLFTGVSFGQIFSGQAHSSLIERSYAAVLPGFEDLPFVGSCELLCEIDGFSGPRTVEQMQTPNTPGVFVGWDFVNTWWHQSGHYPQLMEPILGDLNGDGVVDGADLLVLLSNWGNCADCDDCVADLNGDCAVDVGDLLVLFDNWG